MAELDTTTLDVSLAQIKGYLIETFKMFPGVGNVWNRIRFANDYNEWTKIALLQRDAPLPPVLRAVFVYLSGFSDSRSGKNVTVQASYGIEVVQGFEDGTDDSNSTATYEAFLGKALDHFTRDLYLGFTTGTEVTHTGLQGEGGDGRPVDVDGLLAHRKVLSITAIFTVCR
jgi:hypothetical protein